METRKRRLIEYFKKNLAKKYPIESLKWALINQGYSRAEIAVAADLAHKEIAETAPVLKEKPKITHQIIGEDNRTITLRKPFWRRLLGI